MASSMQLSLEAFETVEWITRVFMTHEDLAPIAEHLIQLYYYATLDPSERGGSTIQWTAKMLEIVRSVPNG